MEAFLTGAAILVAIIFGLALAALAPLVLRGRSGNNNPPPAQPQPAGGNPPPAASPQGGGAPTPGANNAPATGASRWSLPRIPTWVFVVAISAALAYFFWPTLSSTDSIATTAVEVGERAKVIGKDAGAVIVEKGVDAAKAAAPSADTRTAAANWLETYWLVLLFSLAVLTVFAFFVKGTRVGDPVEAAQVTRAITVPLVVIAVLAIVGFGLFGKQFPGMVIVGQEKLATWLMSESTYETTGKDQKPGRQEKTTPPSVTITAPADQWAEPVTFEPGFRVDWNCLDCETQVRIVGNPNWLTMAEWYELEKRGAKLQAARHKGLGKNTVVTHTYSLL